MWIRRKWDAGSGSVEVLVLQLPLVPAIDGVGEVGAEGGHVEMIDAPAHLLVGRVY